MKRTKIIAIFIAFAIIISNCLPILNSIVYASPNKISTVFTANESDGTLSLKQDGKAIVFTMNEVQYEISVREVQSIDPRVEDVKDIVYRDAPDNDYISSNLIDYANMYFRVDAINQNASENDILLEVGGHGVELSQGYSVKSLAELLATTDQPENDCLNVYIRKAYNNQGDPGNPGDPNNPGGGNNEETMSIVFDNATISGNVVSFALDEITTITATVTGANISNNMLEFPWDDLNNVSFTLSGNYNNDTMCVVVRGTNGYNANLSISNFVATFEGLNLPDGGLHFSIEYKQGDPGGPNNPENPGGHPDIDYSSLSDLNIIIENMAIESKMFYGFDGTANIEVPQEQNYGIDMTSDTLYIKLATDITSKPEFFGLYQLHSGEVHGEADMDQINENIDMETLMSGGEISIPINPSERYLIRVIFHSHDLHEIIEDTVTKKATLNEDGIINRSIQNTCILCGDVVGGRGETIAIYHPQTIALSNTSYIYNGKEQKPTVTIKDTQGDIIDSSNYTITYSSGCKNVGTYKAIITFKEKYEGTKELSFKINKATYDMSKVKFENQTVTFNGKNQSLKVTGLPTGVKVTYTNNSKKKIGEYKVTAKFTGDTTNYNVIPNKIAKLTIVPKGTKLSKLTKGSKQFKATWKAQKTETTGYELQYATNKTFTSGKKTVNIKKNKTTSSTVKKLKAKKKYYVRIRTYKTVNGKKYYSGWSKVLNVKTK